MPLTCAQTDGVVENDPGEAVVKRHGPFWLGWVAGSCELGKSLAVQLFPGFAESSHVAYGTHAEFSDVEFPVRRDERDIMVGRVAEGAFVLVVDDVNHKARCD